MKVKFLPQNISVEIQPDESVMDVARKNKLPVSSSCNGMCSCSECRVYIVEGESHILPPSVKEEDLIGEGHFIDRRRLSCQLFCFGDITVDLSEQIEKSKGEVVNKQFLKHIAKSTMKESSSLGGILIEDQEINNIHIAENKVLNKSTSLKGELNQSENNTQNTNFSSQSGKQNHKKRKGRYYGKNRK